MKPIKRKNNMNHPEINEVMFYIFNHNEIINLVHAKLLIYTD
jgi:hypothetical protein